MQSHMSLLRFTQMTGILYLVPFGIGVESRQSNVQSYRFTSRFDVDVALCLDYKLNVIAIATPHNSHPLNLFNLVIVQVMGPYKF